MEKAQHTPGPWIDGYGGGITGERASTTVVLEGAHEKYRVVSGPLICGPHNGRKLICIIPEGDGEEIDARLIATVPEMLEALEDLWASVSGGKKSCGCEYPCVHTGDKVRAVLAKVNGE